jgi:SAM-dependent methyltransferase
MSALPLVCPACGRGLRRESACLSCSCGRSFPRDAAGFHDLSRQDAGQERSLLEHQEQGFFTNETFARFCVERNLAELRRVLGCSRDAVLLDLGCGPGLYARRLAGCYGLYVGLEPASPPPELRPEEPLPDQALLAVSGGGPGLPLAPGSVDIACLIASYDHIPDAAATLRELRRVLKPGGRLVINMTNHGYWLKRLLGAVARKQVFTHAQDHYRVHSAESLIAEVTAALPGAAVEETAADDRHLPNLPKALSALYFRRSWLEALNAALRAAALAVAGKNTGATMIVSFRLPA